MADYFVRLRGCAPRVVYYTCGARHSSSSYSAQNRSRLYYGILGGYVVGLRGSRAATGLPIAAESYTQVHQMRYSGAARVSAIGSWKSRVRYGTRGMIWRL
ncbi:MAG: hypothetical protein IT292_04685 [Deltaproteobacteria bacterium]|nr:hypothetical protein [Deltaproteobacteria bacterium]